MAGARQGRSEGLIAGLVLLGAVASFGVAFTRREHLEDPFLTVFGPEHGDGSVPNSLNVFDVFRIGHAYLWLGIGIALVVVFVVLFATARRQTRIVPLALLAAAIASAGVAFIQRDDWDSALGGIEGAYFNRSVGEPASANAFAGTMFSPFQFGSAYMWAGIAFGLALGAGAAALTLKSRESAKA